MQREDVDRWLRDYVEAWKTYDPDQIGALFAEEITYRYHPFDEPLIGREAVIDSWLGTGEHPGASTRDEPGTYDARYKAVAVEGEVAVATGTTFYSSEPAGLEQRTFDNCFVMRFDDNGRCREFTEWYVERPRPLLVA